jgi:hypothetical protein
LEQSPHISHPTELTNIVLAEAAVAAQWLLSEPYYKVAYAEAYAVLLSRCPPAKRVKPLSNFLSALSGSAKQLTAESIAALVPHFPIELLPEALRLVQSTGEDDDDGYDRIRSLVTLAQYMPAQERRKSLEEALRAARQFEYPYPRVLCFVEIASYLEGEERQKLLAQAQADAEKIGWGDDRADAYARLAEESQGKGLRDLLSGALAQGREEGWDYHRYEALERLSQYFVAEEVSQALLQARAIDDGADIARSLARVTAQLPDDEKANSMKPALAIVRGIQNPYRRARILAGLAPQMPESLRLDAARIAREIKPPGARALALSAFCVEDTQFVSEAIAALHETDYQAELFRDFGRSIRLEEFVEKALLVIREKGSDEEFASIVGSVASLGINDKRILARVLAAMALTSDDRTELLTEVLLIAYDQGEDRRASLLSIIAPHLTDDLLEQALIATDELQDAFHKVIVLTAFASNRSICDRPKLLSGAFRLAQDLEDSASRAKALIALAPYLPEDKRMSALDMAFSIAAEFLDSQKPLEALQLVFSGPASEISRRAFDISLSHFYKMRRQDIIPEIGEHLCFMVEGNAEQAGALASVIADVWGGFQ